MNVTIERDNIPGQYVVYAPDGRMIAAISRWVDDYPRQWVAVDRKPDDPNRLCHVFRTLRDARTYTTRHFAKATP